MRASPMPTTRWPNKCPLFAPGPFTSGEPCILAEGRLQRSDVQDRPLEPEVAKAGQPLIKRTAARGGHIGGPETPRIRDEKRLARGLVRHHLVALRIAGRDDRRERVQLG